MRYPKYSAVEDPQRFVTTTGVDSQDAWSHRRNCTKDYRGSGKKR